MKIIFLDYDGVLSCLRETGGADQPFGTTAVRNLNSLCHEWGADLVLTSAWRWGSKLSYDLPTTRQNAVDFLKFNGIEARLFDDEAGWGVPDLWREPRGNEIAERLREAYGINLGGNDLCGTPWRGDEVQAWLDIYLPGSPTEDWLLLDDEAQYWPTQIHRMVRTDPWEGFDEASLEKALALCGTSLNSCHGSARG